MSKPTNSINKIKDTNNVVHEIVPHSLTDGTYLVNVPTVSSDETIATQEWVLSQAEEFDHDTVVDALGYEPANKAGDIFTGNVSIKDTSSTGSYTGHSLTVYGHQGVNVALTTYTDTYGAALSYLGPNNFTISSSIGDVVINGTSIPKYKTLVTTTDLNGYVTLTTPQTIVASKYMGVNLPSTADFNTYTPTNTKNLSFENTDGAIHKGNFVSGIYNILQNIDYDSRVTITSTYNGVYNNSQYNATNPYTPITAGDIRGLFDNLYTSNMFIPTANLSTKPWVLTIRSNFQLEYTDVLRLCIYGHGGNYGSEGNGFFTSWKLEVADGLDNWVTILDRTNVRDAINGLTVPLWNSTITSSEGHKSYAKFWGIRLTVRGIDNTGGTYGPSQTGISEIRIISSRAAKDTAAAVGALGNRGDQTLYGGAFNAPTLREGGVNLTNKYLGKTAKALSASDADNLGGHPSSYYAVAGAAPSWHTHDFSSGVTGRYADLLQERYNNYNTPSITFRPNIADTRGNRFYGITADRITIEESLDAGATWTFRSPTIYQKQGLFDDPIGNSIQMPKKTDGHHTTNAMLRITCAMANFGDAAKAAADANKLALWTSQNFAGSYIYCNIDRFYTYVGGPVGLNVTLQTAPAPSSGQAPVWTDRMTITRAVGWNGGNTAATPYADFVFGGSATQCPLVRIIIRTCDSDGGYDDSKLSQSTSDMSIFSFAAFGPIIWSSTNPVQVFGTPIEMADAVPGQFTLWGNLKPKYSGSSELGSGDAQFGRMFANIFTENGVNLSNKYASKGHIHRYSANPVYALVNKDTRDTNQQPTWYYSSDETRNSLTSEFKNKNNMGLGSYLSSYFCNVFTVAPWSDASGGYPSQIAIDNSGIAYRGATSNTAWGPWKKLVTDDQVSTVQTLQAQMSLDDLRLQNDAEYRTLSTSVARSLIGLPEAVADWVGECTVIVKHFNAGAVNSDYCYEEFIAKGGDRVEIFHRVYNYGNWSDWEPIDGYIRDTGTGLLDISNYQYLQPVPSGKIYVKAPTQKDIHVEFTDSSKSFSIIIYCDVTNAQCYYVDKLGNTTYMPIPSPGETFYVMDLSAETDLCVYGITNDYGGAAYVESTVEHKMTHQEAYDNVKNLIEDAIGTALTTAV